MSALLVLILILAVLPTAAYAQGGTGNGGTPPGQAKPKGQEGNNDNNSGTAANAAGPLATNGNNGNDLTRLINIPAKRLIGLPIINEAGKQIGKVGDVLVSFVGQRQSGNAQRPASGGEIANGRADYVLAQFGGVLGWGGESVPVPLTGLRLHVVDGPGLSFDNNLVYFQGTAPGDNALAARKQFFNGNALVLTGQQQELKGAPQYDLNQLRSDTDPSWDRSLRAYWQGLGVNFPDNKVADGTAYRVASVRNLDSFGLRELAGDGLGSVDDVLITLAVADPTQAPVPGVPVTNSGNNLATTTPEDQNGAAVTALAETLPIVGSRLDYALVNHGGWWGWGAKTTPMPLGMLMMDRNYDQRSVYTEADNNMLNNAPGLDNNQPNELNDGNFFTRVLTYWQQAGFGPFQQ